MAFISDGIKRINASSNSSMKNEAATIRTGWFSNFLERVLVDMMSLGCFKCEGYSESYSYSDGRNKVKALVTGMGFKVRSALLGSSEGFSFLYAWVVKGDGCAVTLVKLRVVGPTRAD